ncbi:zinc-ribbon domain-containing protein [Leifsonia aquatica]|uniref:zinc-ribbon domain-containing protein n=1 Tax=Leifsonia aquatica TaxID=144185 RepID=UPI0035E42B1D
MLHIMRWSERNSMSQEDIKQEVSSLGDPSCWLHVICDECGAVVEDTSAPCPRCGARL